MQKDRKSKKELKLAVYALSLLGSIASFVYLPTTGDIEDRVASAIGGGFSVLVSNFLLWLLTWIFHRQSWSTWFHQSVEWLILAMGLFWFGRIADILIP
jgi:F0F1-type ATP synthase assembly protein I